MAPDPAAAGEMALIRLCFAADLPTPDEALKALKKNSSDGSSGPIAAPSGPSSGPSSSAALSKKASVTLSGFQDVVRLAGDMRDAKLRTELESYVHLVSFAEGRIELRLADDAPGDLAGRLTQRLKEWTGRQWIVTVNTQAQGEATLRDARMTEVMAHPMVQKALELFPGAEVTTIREPVAPPAPAPDETEEEPPVDPDDNFADMSGEQNEPRKA